MQEYIYMIVAQTGTNVAKAIKFFTKKPYNHVSLASSLELSQMYSFCRTYSRVPLPATFNEEIVGKGTLGLYKNIPCEIYEIPVTKEQKENYERIITHFRVSRRLYSYNILGLVAIYFNISWNRRHHFLCSQFVAYIINELGIELDKAPALYTPNDLRNLPNANLIYTGELNRWYFNDCLDYLYNKSKSKNYAFN